MKELKDVVVSVYCDTNSEHICSNCKSRDINESPFLSSDLIYRQIATLVYIYISQVQ